MSLSDFEIQKELGKGAFGCVYIAKRKADENLYAMKRVKVSTMSSKDKENALNEVRVLASLCHPNVIDYKEAFYDEESGTLNIVMEFADEGDIANKIKFFKNKKAFIPENEVWSYLIQMICGLKSLHDKKIMHRDLKSANVFLTKKGEVKLGDLNVSKVVKLGFLHTQTGTPYYASPEVWSEKPYEYKSDLWSVGCILYELCALKPPFRAQCIEQLYKAVIKGVYDQIPSNYSKDLQNIVACLLNVDPKKRPTCDILLTHPTIKKKIEAGNLQLTVCQGKLLNTIKWTLHSGDINSRLSKLKRYNFKLDKKDKIQKITEKTPDKLHKPEKTPNKLIGNNTVNTLNSSTTSNSGTDSKEKFQMKSNSPLFAKYSSYKSPLVIRKYINLIEKDNSNLNNVRKAKNILDIITAPSNKPKNIYEAQMGKNSNNNFSRNRIVPLEKDHKARPITSIEIDLSNNKNNEYMPRSKKSSIVYLNGNSNYGTNLKPKIKTSRDKSADRNSLHINTNILNKKTFAKSPNILTNKGN